MLRCFKSADAAIVESADATIVKTANDVIVETAIDVRFDKADAAFEPEGSGKYEVVGGSPGRGICNTGQQNS